MLLPRSMEGDMDKDIYIYIYMDKDKYYDNYISLERKNKKERNENRAIKKKE